MINLIIAAAETKPLLETHVWANVIATAIFVLFIFTAIKLVKHSFWGPRLRQGFKSKSAKFGLFIALLFLLIALIDSFSWKDHYTNEDQVAVEARDARSLLDRGFSLITNLPEYQFKERSTSAPFAKTEFFDKKVKLTYTHVFGTNASGTDTLYLVLKGVRTAVIIGTVPLLVTLPLAIVFGLCAGYFGGKLDDIVVYIYTVLSSIPSLLMLIAIVYAIAASGQNRLLAVCVALGVTSWVGICRLVRGETMKLKELEYIQAAKCLGTPTWKIVFKHILPNLTHIILITCILTFTALVLFESILAYLGVGLDGSWGSMIANAKSEIAQDPIIWWNLVFASTALFLLVLSVNIVGDAIRNAIDPKAAQE
jgi:peptide/nickel transport system permease protein